MCTHMEAFSQCSVSAAARFARITAMMLEVGTTLDCTSAGRSTNPPHSSFYHTQQLVYVYGSRS